MTEIDSEVVSSGLFHSVTKIRISRTNESSSEDLDIHITNEFSRWHTILFVTGGLFLGGSLLFVIFRLCKISWRTIWERRTGRRPRRATPQENRVNEILSNSGARQILSSLARTAVNSQTNRRDRVYESQISMNSVGDVLDISERVVRVSFAPSVVVTETPSEETVSLGPPAYETLAPISLDPPPLYSEVSKSPRKRQEDSDSEQSKDSESLQLQRSEHTRKNSAEHSECSESSFPGESLGQSKPKAERRKRKESRK